MRLWTVVMTAVVLIIPGPTGYGQSTSSPPAPTGVVTGRVVDATTGTGLRGAQVTLSQISDAPAVEAGDTPGRSVVTTVDGQYAFRNLAAGRYTINATRRGYVSGGVGARRPGGRRQLIVLNDGETVTASPITLWKYAAISGRVLDEGGDPVIGARVRALRRTPPRVREFGGEWSDETDDLGTYRISGLPPGDYVIAVASISLDGSPAYPITFYPSAPAPDRAEIVTVAAGDDRTGVDFHLTPASGARVRGRVQGANGPAAGNVVTLRLPDAELFPFNLDVATTLSGPGGEFAFNAVSAGSYVLQVTKRPAPAGTRVRYEYGSATIRVDDRDIDDLVLQLRPGARVSGRLTFEGGVTPMPSLLAETRVYLDGVDERSFGSGPATPDRFGRFTTPAVPPGRYRLRIGIIHAGWMFKSAMYEGQNIADEPFALESSDITGVLVTFTTRGTRLSGVVRSERGHPDPETSVLIYPAARELWTSTTSMWRMRSVRASTRGTYTVTSLPPGEYLVLAVPEEQWANWHDPVRLVALAPRATRVRILEGQTHVQDLRTVR